MGHLRLTEDMTRLRGEIDALRIMRGAFIDDMKADVTDMRAGFRKNQHEMARNLKGDLVAFVVGLENSVDKTMEGIRDTHEKMASEQRETLDANESQRKQKARDDTAGRMDEVAERVRDIEGKMAEFRRNHAEMSGKSRDDLVAFVSGLERSVTEMMEGIRDTHEKMASKLNETLGANEAQRKRKARDDHEERRAEIIEQKKTVLSVRQEIAAEIAGARQAWLGPAPVAPEFKKAAVLATEAMPPQPEEDAVEEKAEILAAEIMPDDFTVITGIGPARQKQLNDAGYYTFSQLVEFSRSAQSNPEKLQEILGESGKSVNLENWIKEAGDLAE